MSTYEWISLIIVLVGGFYSLSVKLGKIETSLSKRVSYEECSVKRDKCPCVIERNDRIRADLERTRTLNMEK